jgi:hypothetical protein
MSEFFPEGGREISPGPRGFSIIGAEVSQDGSTVYFLTDQPGRLNGIPLPKGNPGGKGDYGDPGEARIRIDETVGYRVFLWDVATAGENMVYGDTGVWTLPASSTWVHREGNVVETNAATPNTLPDGFKPAVSTTAKVYITAQPWPAEVLGTITTPPYKGRGLEGYTAAVAQGYPGTAEQWMNMIYRVVLPPAGVTGQVLTRTREGSAWLNLPRIGPGAWTNITLTNQWKASSGPYGDQVPQVRNNNGTIEMIGDVTYTGPTTNVGIWGTDFVKIGTIPPAFAPEAHYDLATRVFKGLLGAAGTPVPARIDVDTQGQIYLGAFDLGGDITLPIRANITKVNLGALPSFPLRNSSNGA